MIMEYGRKQTSFVDKGQRLTPREMDELFDTIPDDENVAPENQSNKKDEKLLNDNPMLARWAAENDSINDCGTL